jgi:Flp pilus assembly protein TadB
VNEYLTKKILYLPLRPPAPIFSLAFALRSIDVSGEDPKVPLRRQRRISSILNKLCEDGATQPREVLIQRIREIKSRREVLLEKIRRLNESQLADTSFSQQPSSASAIVIIVTAVVIDIDIVIVIVIVVIIVTFAVLVPTCVVVIVAITENNYPCVRCDKCLL